MQITLYQCNDDNRVLNKTLNNPVAYNAIFPLDSISEHSPQFILTYNANILNKNYLYCPDLNRYYYISSTELLTGSRILLSCSVDVLMSFKDDILSSNALVTRNESVGLSDIVDEKLPLLNYKEIAVIEFNGTDFNSDVATENSRNFVLNIAGGETS